MPKPVHRTPPKRKVAADLYDPRAGAPPIRIQPLQLGKKPTEPQRTNYFSIYRIEEGAGIVHADAAHFPFGPRQLLFFVPYQHLRFIPSRAVRGDLLQFHANFLCVETFHAEAGCSGILFNDPYGIPVVTVDEASAGEIAGLIERIQREQQENSLAASEVMLAYLKVLLILAARVKAPRGGACDSSAGDHRHPVLREFRELIEHNYASLHSPADYAERLHVTPKTLGRVVREQLGTTPTDLIRNRLLIHAKWQLLHTLKSVKEISRELGFADELYFSRLFKKATGFSPTFFRECETEIRGGSNLSMVSSPAPILPKAASSDS